MKRLHFTSVSVVDLMILKEGPHRTHGAFAAWRWCMPESWCMRANVCDSTQARLKQQRVNGGVKDRDATGEPVSQRNQQMSKTRVVSNPAKLLVYSNRTPFGNNTSQAVLCAEFVDTFYAFSSLSAALVSLFRSPGGLQKAWTLSQRLSTRDVHLSQFTGRGVHVGSHWVRVDQVNRSSRIENTWYQQILWPHDDTY